MLGKYFLVRGSAAITTAFDYYRRTEPLVILFGPRGFDYYRRTEPIQGVR